MAYEGVKEDYLNMIMAAKRRWEETPSGVKELWWAGITRKVSGFLLWWASLKEIEKKFNIDVWGVAREMQYKSAFAHGERLARNYKKHGLSELYEAHFSNYEGVCEIKYIEFNDEVLSMWFQFCPFTKILKDQGKTPEERKEMASLFCLWDYGVIDGFNPDFETFSPPRLIMKGDSYSTFHVEHHRKR